MEKQIEELAHCLIGGEVYTLPIESIDGVRVKCDMFFMYQTNINRTDLVIGGMNVFRREDEESCVMKLYEWKQKTNIADLTIPDAVEMITNMMAQLGGVKYNKLDNMLRCETKPNKLKAVQQITRSLFDLPNIKMKYSDSICCVCHDMTSSRTPCGHELCLQCLEKMPYTEPPDNQGWEEGQKGKTCPMCREFLISFE